MSMNGSSNGSIRPAIACAAVLLAGTLATASPTQEEMNRIAFQVPGRDLRTQPPRISSIYLFPNEKGNGDGKILMEVRIDEKLPDILKFIWMDEITTLRDDGQGGDRWGGDGIYSARISMDIKKVRALRTAANSGDLVGLAAEARGGVAVPVFGKDYMTPELRGGEMSPTAKTEFAAATADPLFVDAERSLLIRDLSVVNNSARTKDPCQSTSSADANKVWTFGYLLKNMANQSYTGKSASQFAIDWLDRWSSYSPLVNGQSLSQQPSLSIINTPATIKSRWLAASGSTTTLALNKAPFRLLAIVNRLDLRHNLMFGGGLAGELRFVFTVLDNSRRESTGGPCQLLDVDGGSFGRKSHTVILEYAVDKQTQDEVFQWAQRWQALSNMTLGSTQYLDSLQALTKSVVDSNKGGSPYNRPNKSALIRIRTNQSLNNTVWEFREFQIDNTQGSAYRFSPVPVTVKQTPQGITSSNTNDKNQTSNLGRWMLNNLSSIESETHVVPNTLPSSQGYLSPLTGFLGARAVTGKHEVSGLQSSWDFLFYWVSGTNPSTGQNWLDFNNSQHIQVRHLFSKNTCNGCHGGETKPPDLLGTSGGVFHIEPRVYGQRSNLSNFLTGLQMVDNPPPDLVYVPDPVVPSVERHFNDLEARKEDMINLLYWGPQSALSFQPSARTH